MHTNTKPTIIAVCLILSALFAWTAFYNTRMEKSLSEKVIISGTLVRVGTGKSVNLCFIDLNNGEKLIVHCSKSSMLVNVPIQLEKKVFSNKTVRYNVLD